MADESGNAELAQGAATGANADARQLSLQKIYVKDLSFESPKAPEIFGKNVSPQTQLNLRYGNKDLGEDNVEVTLTLTVEAKDGDQTLFLIEITYAGAFLVKGYAAEERAAIVGSFCPNTLYPFAREAIADIVQKGGFPQLLLQPINFDALYAQALKDRASRVDQGAQQSPPAEETH